MLDELGCLLEKEIQSKILVSEKAPEQLNTGTIYLINLELEFENIKRRFEDLSTSILVFGEPSKLSSKILNQWQKAQIVLEDTGLKPTRSNELRASDKVPTTSFAYLSNEFFSGGMKKAS